MRIGKHLTAALLAAALVSGARTARAQAWFYPSFQIPTVVDRDYTGAVAGGNGTAFVFQWREGLDLANQLSLDVGLADPDGASNTRVLVGGNYAHQLGRATRDQPLDLLLTAGLGLALGNSPNLVRIPVGLSVGHRFQLDGPLAITPYVHPRISLDFYRGEHGDVGDRNHVTLDFDLGGNLELSSQLALRASVLFTGGQGGADTGVGLGLTFTPRPLKR